jgi:hypothetical protein
MTNSQQGLNKEFLAERDLRIFKMRQSGVTQAEIARRFNMTTSAVGSAIRRQLQKMNSEALMAYPEVLRMELERLDALQAAIWPLTQHRRVKMDDGTEVAVEPDMKAVQTALSIMDRRSKLLGMEQNNVNIQMDINSVGNSPIRATLAGVDRPAALNAFNPEEEVRKLLQLMGESGVLPEDTINEILGSDTSNKQMLNSAELNQPIDAEVIEDE